jgi:hypothetical protein
VLGQLGRGRLLEVLRFIGQPGHAAELDGRPSLLLDATTAAPSPIRAASARLDAAGALDQAGAGPS